MKRINKYIAEVVLKSAESIEIGFFLSIVVRRPSGVVSHALTFFHFLLLKYYNIYVFLSNNFTPHKI